MKKTILLIIVVCFLFSNKSYSQKSDSTLIIGEPAFKLIPDTTVRVELANSLRGFLKTRNENLAVNQFVDQEYLKASVEPFLWLRNAEGKKKDGSNLSVANLTSVLPVEKDRYILKISYMGIMGETNLPKLNLLATIEARKKGNQYYFYDAVDYNTRHWNIKQIGSIKYIYASKLDEYKAKKMDDFNTSFAKKFNTEPLKITYYKCDDPEQLFKMLGFDYIENMYYSLSGGLAYQWTNTLLAGNNSELYEHEAVHFYTSKLFPHSTRAIDEGYATYIGGSGGIEIAELAVFAKNYLIKNPKTDFASLPTDFKIRVEHGIPLAYILNALVCKDVDERFGIEGIKQLYSPKPDDDYFTTLKRINGIGKDEFAAYLNKLLKGVKN